MIPKVQSSSVDSVREAYDREGMTYVDNMMNEVFKKQPVITSQIAELLGHLDSVMENAKIEEEMRSYILENVGYRSFAMVKSLYIQEEVNELEESSLVGVDNGQN